MKKIEGWNLPDSDIHFGEHLGKGARYRNRGTYQFKKIAAALNQMTRTGMANQVAIDVGAHVGFWSFVLADWFAHVVAFEPVPELVACFESNMDGLRNVTLRPVAVSHEPGELFMSAAHKNTGNCSIARFPADPTWTVQATTLDAECLGGGSLEGEARVGFIKIDVEGWELEVVRGGEQLIRACRPFMVVEQKPGNAERYGFRQHEAVELLQSWGARVLWEKSGDFCLGWV